MPLPALKCAQVAGMPVALRARSCPVPADLGRAESAHEQRADAENEQESLQDTATSAELVIMV